MAGIPQELGELDPDELYDALDTLRRSRRSVAWDRSEQGYYHREYCDAEMARLKLELRRRRLPVKRPEDDAAQTPAPVTVWTGECSRCGQIIHKGAREPFLPPDPEEVLCLTCMAKDKAKMEAKVNELQMQLFDYMALDTETRIVVQRRTEEIKDLMRRTAQDILDIGGKLADVRDRLEGGAFSAWLRAEFDWSRSTAYNFINVHERFGSRNLAELEISASALYLLAAPSTPPTARDEAVARAETGEAIGPTTAKAIVGAHQPRRYCRTCGEELTDEDGEWCAECEPELMVDVAPEPEPEPEPQARVVKTGKREVDLPAPKVTRSVPPAPSPPPKAPPVMVPVEPETPATPTVLIVLRVLPGEELAARRVMGTVGEEGRMPSKMLSGTYGELAALVQGLQDAYFGIEVESEAEVLAEEA